MHHCTWYIIVENRGRPRAVHNGQFFKINETFQNQTNAIFKEFIVPLKLKIKLNVAIFYGLNFMKTHKKIGF